MEFESRKQMEVLGIVRYFHNRTNICILCVVDCNNLELNKMRIKGWSKVRKNRWFNYEKGQGITITRVKPTGYYLAEVNIHYLAEVYVHRICLADNYRLARHAVMQYMRKH